MRPCHDLHVELALVDPSQGWFVLDADRLDGPKTLAPYPLPNIAQPVGGAFTLDVSLLDSTTDLIEGGAGNADLPAGFVWVEYTSETMDIAIDRGVDIVQGIVSRPTAGTLVAQIVDPYLDALANQNVGLDTIVRVRVGNRPVFTGEVTKLLTTYEATGIPVVNVEAADSVARLNSVQVGVRPPETFSERLEGIGTVAGVSMDVTPGGRGLTGTDKPRSALDALHLTCDSEGSLAWVDVRGEVHALHRDADGPAATGRFLFADDHTLPDHVCFTAVQVGLATDDVINQLQVANIEHNTTDPANPRWETVSYEFADHLSADYYGVGAGNVTTTLPPADVPGYAAWAFGRFAAPQRKVHRIAYVTDELDDRTIPEVAFIDVADTVTVDMDHRQHPTVPRFVENRRVARISHRITPERWSTELSLI